MKGKLRRPKDGCAKDDEETPAYATDSSKCLGSEFFTLKVFYGGEFDGIFEHYNGGDVAYFDYISRFDLSLTGLQEMLEELGLEKGSFDVWLQLPGRELHSSSIMPLESDLHVQMFGDLIESYSTLLNIYITPTCNGFDYDFSFTQYELDERERIVDEIREEFEKENVEKVEEQEQSRPGEITEEEEQLKYYCDTSNLDSTETEAPPPKRRQRRIPPPNPPYRTRKKGRYSMLRGLFKNTEKTPVVLDEDDVETDHSDRVVPDTEKENKNSEFVDEFVQDKRQEFEDHEQRFAVDKEVEEHVETADEKSQEFEEEEQGFDADEEVEDDVETADEKRGEFGSSDDSQSMYDSNDERMAVSSCDEMDPQYPEFNELTDMQDPKFELGMLFSSGKAFRAVVRKHAIVHQRPIRLRKNLAHKIKWKCAEGCQWKCHGIKQQRSSNIQIKTLCTKHSCNPTWEQKQVNSRWIAEEYEDQIRMNPTWKLASFHHQVINDLKCQVSYSMIYRAMRKAKETILGKHEEEFKKLYNYGNELMKAMPGSTVKLMTEPNDGVDGRRRFKRFYICLDFISVVDIKQHHCACRKWQLTGIPCFHACACILFKRQNPLDYLHECYKRRQYLNVYEHILEPINGEEFWDQVEETEPLPPIIKVAPGRPKKNRKKTSDVVETRKNDPTMLKRKGTTLKCGKCDQYGHNSRTCHQENQEKEKKGVDLVKKPVICYYCKGEGHNSRTCKTKKVDMETKKKEKEAQIIEEATKKGNNKGKGPATHVSATHGGVMKPFKAPTQVGPLGVHYVSYIGKEGQLQTSATKVNEARCKKQKVVGKKMDAAI